MTDSSENDPKKAKFVEVDAEYSGQRIDNFLLARLRSVPKSLIYKVLRTGQVRVNKGRIKPAYRLEAGDIIRIPPIKLDQNKPTATPGRAILERVERSIIHEDSELIVLNKPSGIAVHGGSGLSFGIIEAMRQIRPELKTLELVHRLDRDTSGCLLLTKKRSALRQLHELIRNSEMKKYYLALCQGKWRGNSQIIDVPLKKNTLKSGERLVRVDSEGKEAKSRFSCKQRFKMATLMDVEIFTGRTHQIRVHAAHAGHPLAGDDKYGDKSFNQEMKKRGLKRLFLHAAKLSFSWEKSKSGRFEIQAPLDDTLEDILDKLR